MTERKNNKKVGFSISKKIMTSIILVNIIAIMTIAGIVAYLLNENVGNEARDYASSMVEANVNKFQQEFSNIETATNVIGFEVSSEIDLQRAKEEPLYLEEFKQKMIPRLKEIGENTDLTRSIYLYFNVEKFQKEVDIWMLKNDQGKLELQAPFGMEYYKGYNAWYSEPIDNGATMWTFPYQSSTGGYITSYITPIVVEGEIVALVGMDLYLDDVEKTLSEVQLFDTGYLYLMHADGRTIVHPRIEFGSNILDVGDFQFLLDEMNANESGFTTYERDDGKGVVSAYGHLNNGWVLGSSIPENEVMKIVAKVLTLLGAIAIGTIFISILVSLVIGRTITKPILKIVDATKNIKEGDFTTVVEVNSNDETGLLADGLNAMSASIKELIQEAKRVSSDMVDSASTLAAMSEETNATVDQVAHSVKEIDHGTQDTAKEAENGADIASQIDRQFLKLMENSSLMKVNADAAIEMNQLGQETISLLREKSEESQISNKRVTEAVNNLDDQTKEITNIIGTITSIAVQTNLLALNASIEAARAGDAGRGFAVVAEEIRKLAESSTISVNEISDIVTNIQRESKDTVHIMNEVSLLSEDQNEVVENVHEAFGKIFNSVEGITDQIEIVTTELNCLNESKSELIGVITNISAVAEETSAATEQVRHSMEDQTLAVEQVAANAEQLNELSSDLNSKIEAFKI